MSRANPASGDAVPGCAGAAVAPNAVKRPIAKATAATATATSTTASHRGTRRLGSLRPVLPLIGDARPAGTVDGARAARVGLGNVLAAPVLLEELGDALVGRGLDLQLAVPSAQDDRRVQPVLGREDDVRRGQLRAQGDRKSTRLHSSH